MVDLGQKGESNFTFFLFVNVSNVNRNYHKESKKCCLSIIYVVHQIFCVRNRNHSTLDVPEKLVG
jgi:hypothetical protein